MKIGLWKVYKMQWTADQAYTKYIPWDGVYVEASTIEEAVNTTILRKNDINIYCYDLYEYYFAVPEGWKLPLDVKYKQLELIYG